MVIQALLQLDGRRLFAAGAWTAAALTIGAIAGGALEEHPGWGLRPGLRVFLIAFVVLVVASWLYPECCRIPF